MLSRMFVAIAVASMTIHAAVAQEVILAVNEGVTYLDGGPSSERYKPLLELLGKELKRPVKVKSIDKYADFDKALAEEKYDLVFIHPAHIGLRAVKSGKYVGLATAKGFTDYRARIMVKKDSPIKSVQDLRGKKIAVPSLESITTVMFIANLHELNFAQPEKTFTATRYQDAVPFMIEQGFVEAGVTGSAAVEKAWVAKGGRVIAETKPIPIKQFLASKNLKESDRTRIHTLLLTLADTETGRAALAKIGMTGFVPWNSDVMNEAMARLGL
jgi:phosphonate transport system substrate-binding protein